MAALEGLISAPSDRALPLLDRVLNGNHSERVKARALFVLSQIDHPEAQNTILNLAKNNQSPLQHEAIRVIGIAGHRASLDELKNIYSSGDRKVKEQVMQAYLIAGDEQKLFELAENAKTDDEFDAAVQKLGAMGETELLQKLAGRAGQSDSLLQAYAVSGDLDSLLALAHGEVPDTHDDIRLKAISNIGIVGGLKGKRALMDIYQGATESSVKHAALQGLLIAGHDRGVLQLYKQSDNLEDKRKLLQTLSIMNSDVALDAIDAALDGGQ